MTDDIRDDLFANCALWAYVEVAIERASARRTASARATGL